MKFDIDLKMNENAFKKINIKIFLKVFLCSFKMFKFVLAFIIFPSKNRML